MRCIRRMPPFPFMMFLSVVLFAAGIPSGEVVSVTRSPDGNTLAGGRKNSTARLWVPAAGNELLALGAPQEQPSGPAGPTVTLGIEITLSDGSVFYIPAIGSGEMLGVIPVSQGRFAGIRIVPSMSADSVKIEVSALVNTHQKLSKATCNEIRSWQSEDAGFYEGKKDGALSLSGLKGLGLPVFKVRVVQAYGPPPSFAQPYAGFHAYCGCTSFLSPGKCSEQDALGVHMTPCGFSSYPGAGKCVEFSGCGQCCRVSPPSGTGTVSPE